ETKVGMVEDDQLAEVYLERENEYTLAGSIYKGRVTRVLPGMQSAFVDIGLERDAFLYVSDFMELENTDEDLDDVPAGAMAERRSEQGVATHAAPEVSQEVDSADEAATEGTEARSNGEPTQRSEARNDDRGGFRGRRRRRGGRERGERGGRNGQERPSRPAEPDIREVREVRTEREDYGPPAGYQP